MNAPVRLTLSSDSTQRLQQLQDAFPQASGNDLAPDWRGGRAQALERLAAMDVSGYAQSRNHLDGAVTRLSPYLRHGCLSLPEAVQHVLSKHRRHAAKLVAELSYRDYFRQVWYRFGQGILQEMEPPKVALGQKPMPDFIEQGFTGLVCMDEIVHTLQKEGYVHNHARMWFAAYAVHWLKIDWRQAADWFEQRLLDGNLASNHLSWQWIASSFSQKPYFFNKENLVKFGGDHWCKQCRVQCPFDASYEQLEQQLFQKAETTTPLVLPQISDTAATAPCTGQAGAVWLHDEMLSPSHPLLARGLPVIFIFDPVLYADWPLKRLQFMADCLAEIPEAEVWIGDTHQVLMQRSRGHILTQRTPNPQLQQVASGLNIEWLAEPALHEVPLSDHALMRFSRYWKVVSPTLIPVAAAN